MANKVVFITTTGTGTFTVPSDFSSLVSVEAIGCGGNGSGGSPSNGGGGGGGAYAKSTTMSGLSAGSTAYYNLPAGGAATDTWFNPTANSKPTSNLSSGTTGIIAASGKTATTGTGGSGGSVIDSTGDVRYAGGTGGSSSNARSGGGGAAGPGGNGGDGGQGNPSGFTNGGGGGSGATLTVAGTNGSAGTGSVGGAGGASTGQTGGSGATTTVAANNTAPTNGGGGGGGNATSGVEPGGAGGNGTYWTQSSNSATAGSGGGSGGASGAASGVVGAAGLYGGGGGGGNTGAGGAGAQGIIVFTYTPATKTVFITTTGSGTYKIPSDFVSLVSVEAIGGGGAGSNSSSGGAPGGGGGAYAKSTSVSGLVAGQTCYYYVGAGGVTGTSNGDGGSGTATWFNASSNAMPTLTSQGVKADSGNGGENTNNPGRGGQASNCVGSVSYNGGNGGTAASKSGGGGGGAAGPGGIGGNGGNGNSTSTGTAGGGGGGASLTHAGYDGSAGTATGNGGNGGDNTGGGAAGAPGSPGTAGTGGGGGGGQSTKEGGNGATGTTSFTQTSDSTTAGSGGGGGGGVGNTGGGSGGLYGGGGGGWGTASALSYPGAQGIIVFTYTYNAALYTNKTVFFTTVGSGTYRIPSDFLSFISVEAIGGGASANKPNGGGGGAYSKSTTMTGLTAGGTAYYSVGAGGPRDQAGITGGDSWFSLTNSAPVASSSGAAGVLAKGGTAAGGGANGGAAASGCGDVRYSGGSGDPSNEAGGGGAAGPGGNGGNGGAGTSGGGGGGGGASLNAAGNNGSPNSGTSGGAGGNGGGGTGGGAGGTLGSVNGVTGTAGTGGGGGGAYSQTGGNTAGGFGGTGSFWTQTSDSSTAGSGGGGGGAGSSSNPNQGGDGGLYGGGGGSSVNQPIGLGGGGQGIVVFTYLAYLGTVYPSPKPRSNFQKDDPVYGKVDLDDTYVTDAWLLEKYVGNNLFSWGLGTSGGIGDNTTADKSSPVQIGRLSTWKQVATAGNTAGTFSLATKTDGTLWGWGGNSSGQIGNSTTVALSSPVQVGTLTNWKQVSVGRNIAAAIKTDNTLWTWGNNLVGALGGVAAGTGNTVDRSSPVQIGTAYSWKQVSIGGGASTQYTMAVGNDNSLWAIGGVNTLGGLGDGTTTTRSSPVQIGALEQWSQVSAGYQHTMAIQTDGTLWGWGDNTNGSLGTPSYYTTSWSSPIQIGSLNNWSKISGRTGSISIKTDGTMWAWGISSNTGGLGLGTTLNYSSPVQIGSLTTWASVTSNNGGGFAIKTNGTLWSWGDGANGQLGDGTTVRKSSPVQVGSLTTWSKVSSTGNDITTTAIKTDGTLWAWGVGVVGSLGNGNTLTVSTPVQVGTLTTWASSSTAGNTAANGSYTLAIKTDGTLWAWGYGVAGCHGTGNTTNKSTPVQVGTQTNWSSTVACRLGNTANASFGITTTGTLWAWGKNLTGVLGDNSGGDKSTPVQIGTLNTWSKVAASGQSGGTSGTAAAIKTDGTLWMWGANANGQLCDGTTVDKSSPIQIGTQTNWTEVQVGENAVIAVKTDGTLWGWGLNTSGEVGTSFPYDLSYSSPIQIGQLTNWKAVAANYQYTLALKTDNTLWAWGNNALGNIGDGTTVDKESPVQVGYLTDWKSLATISTSTAASPGAPSGAIKTDGTLWVWGVNTSGVLGDGTTTNKSSPIQIGLQTNWKQVSFADALSGKGITFNDI